jgi:osmotically-inducible protein OsmY
MTKPNECGPVTIDDCPGRCGHRSSVERGLEASGYLALRQIQCDCRGGVLCLRGDVSSHYLKQVAQAIAAAVEGVRRVDNQIKVLSAETKRTVPADHDRS